MTPAASQSGSVSTAKLATRDFDRIYRAPTRRRASPRFLLLAQRRPQGGPTRYGISVQARLGGAVLRNRVKRRLREILRRLSDRLPAGWDLVVQPRTGAVAKEEFAALTRELESLLAATLRLEREP